MKKSFWLKALPFFFVLSALSWFMEVTTNGLEWVLL